MGPTAHSDELKEAAAFVLVLLLESVLEEGAPVELT